MSSAPSKIQDPISQMDGYGITHSPVHTFSLQAVYFKPDGEPTQTKNLLPKTKNLESQKSITLKEASEDTSWQMTCVSLVETLEKRPWESLAKKRK